jgi:hypothetical protein
MTLLPPASRGTVPDGALMNHLRAGMIGAIELTPVNLWPAMIAHAEIDHGASMVLPDPASNWASHLAELSLLGITGRGDTLEAAVRDWAKAAGRTLEIGRAA